MSVIGIGLIILAVAIAAGLAWRQDRGAMTLARALCIGLVLLGALLGAADLLEAHQYGHTLAVIGAKRHVWQWGLACIISGVLGIVALEASGAARRTENP